VLRRSKKVGFTTAAASLGTRCERTTFQPEILLTLPLVQLRERGSLPKGSTSNLKSSSVSGIILWSHPSNS
jgi:hypothetical protein